jgi:hypothetical protein
MASNSGTLYRGQDGRMYTDIVVSKTVTAADCGVVQNVIASGVVFTLPSGVVGMDFTFRNEGAPAGASVYSGANGNALTITPAAADGIAGLNLTATVNKSLYNQTPGGATTAAAATGTGALAGDEIELVGSVPSSASAWEVSHAIGFWTRQT